ncbi:sulfatase-like hydrolase/transferase [Lutibacter sp. A80]|uniref:sulfatase-like hydrolase/transferase n=1 Tax=Lutibacter sp. A80 TaxID=2918453 RepID=UPI001F05E1B7|nr:sulfatase-like hydrolase/transferase [Lutibacter sp. A80]UMB61772.1 sulfatase-like hydrolase/transferase [Lutibacter sp. A80]
MRRVMLFLFSILLLSCLDNKEQIIKQPNIIIIVADDLGYGDISSFGNTTIKTPNIDALATTGIKFTDFHSNGAVCSPTRAALMTGKYQQRTGIEGVVTAKSHRDVGLSLAQVTIAEELSSYGYNSAMFGKWHLGYAKEYNPSLQGFHQFEGFVSGNIDYHAHIDQEGYLDWWKETEIKNREGYSTDLITENGVKFIKDNSLQKTAKPFFLYLPHEAPHGPYQRRIDKVLREVGSSITKPVVKDSIASIYKEMVEVMDEGVGKIIKTLKETGQYENTIVIFFSDNGANHFGNNGVLRGGKGSAYEGGSRVPAMISYPAIIKDAIVSDQTVLTMDILPTLLDFIAQKPSAKDVDGISIKNHLLNQTKLPERDVYFGYGRKSFIRSGNWKLIKTQLKEGSKMELYNLSNDLKERNNLSEEKPELVEELLKKLRLWENEVTEGVEKISK